MGFHQRHQMEPLFQAFHSDSEASRASLVAKMLKNPPVIQETRVRLVGREDPLEKEMTTHSHIFAWRSLWTEEPGRLEPKGLQRVGHDRATHIFVVQGLPDQRERVLPVFSMRDVFPEAPSQHSLLSYWPELCHVAHASSNQQAGSSSCPKAAESNIEKGSFPSPVSVLWGRTMWKPLLPCSQMPSPPPHLSTGRQAALSRNMTVTYPGAIRRSFL